MTAVDWDALQVGDPDPTPLKPPWCRARTHEDDRGLVYWVCTREPGHTGPHVASNGLMPENGVDFGRSVVAIWPSDG